MPGTLATGATVRYLPSPDHVFGQTGFFNVTQVVSNSYGCRDSLSQEVEIYPQTEASFQAIPERGCAPLTVQFTNTSLHYDNVFWDFGEGVPSTDDNPTHIYNLPNETFTVRLIVDTAGFCPDTAALEIEVGQAPIADFDVLPYDSCGPGAVNFINRSSTTNPPLAYLWEFGNGSISAQEEPTRAIHPAWQLQDPAHGRKCFGLYGGRLTNGPFLPRRSGQL
jgi:PKD repeat protein